MARKLSLLAVVALLATTGVMAVLTSDAQADPPPRGDAVVYVTSQGLFYDSIVNGELPPHGPFQVLEMGGPSGLQTEFGPGDPGYRGGRWKLDTGGGEYIYFSCPLLPPGRENP